MRIAKVIPPLLVEIPARLGAYFIGLWRPAWSYPFERKIRGTYWSLAFGTRKLEVGRQVQFEGDHAIKLGVGVRVNDGCQVVAGSAGTIEIGPGSHLARLTLIAGGGGVKIGARTMVSSLVAIYSIQNRLDSARPAEMRGEARPVHIGDDVFIGVGAKILPGVTIGSRAVIAAGAVVNSDVPENTVVGGVPATPLMSNLR